MNELPKIEIGEFKPHVFVNEEVGLTEVIFEDCAYVAVPVFEGCPHWIDKYVAMSDGRVVGMAVWATTPLEGDGWRSLPFFPWLKWRWT